MYERHLGHGLGVLDTALYRSGEVKKAVFPDWWPEVITC
jgi:hypothetical protein